MTTIAVVENRNVTARERISSSGMERPRRIAFFGVFGIENLGNECTLQAVLGDIRKRLPDEEIYAICFEPADTFVRHKLPAVGVTQQNFAGIVRRPGFVGALAKIWRLRRRIPGEVKDWMAAVKTLRGTDLVVMTGTGMLTDYMTSASGFPYDIFRWAGAARLAGCKVRFLGVGVGPIYGRLSRWLIKSALHMADYRSFRDQNSKDRIKKIGYNSDKDPIFPDLAFSLPPEIFPHRAPRTGKIKRVGVGVMDHRDIHLANPEKRRIQHAAYLEKMADFVCWLIEHKYTIRILQGDARHDAKTRAELKTRLEKRGLHYDQAGISDEDSTTVEELIAQISEVDMVVSPRFHTLLLGLMMNIPALSISYDPKNDQLLTAVGLGNYCQPIFDLDVNRLISQFIELEARFEEVIPDIEEKKREYRRLLDTQYNLVFGEFAARQCACEAS